MNGRFNIVCLAMLILLLLLQCVPLKEARNLYQTGDYSSSIQHCRQAVDRDSTHVEAWFLLSKNYAAIDSFPQAIQAIEKAHGLDPDNAQIQQHYAHLYLTLGHLAAEEKKFRNAVQHFKKAKTICPADTLVLDALGNYWESRGQLKRARHEYDHLKGLVQDTVETCSRIQHIDNQMQTAETHIAKGQKAMGSQHFKTAQSEFKKALKAQPDNPNARYHLNMAAGRSLYKTGKKKNMWEAIEAFGEAMAVCDTLAEPHYWMAKAYERKDDREFTNAIDEYQTVLELEPKGPYAAEAHKRLKKLKQLKQKLDKFWGR